MVAATVLAACLWSSPGADPYRGPVGAALESYTDIPADVRQRLRARVERRQFDEVAEIRRDSIEGLDRYTDLREMHFAGGRLCLTVDRSAWKPDHLERGLIYCEDEHCIIVPTVCNNVSRVTRLARPAEAAPTEPTEPGGGGVDAVARTPAVVEPAPPITFASASSPTPPFVPIFAPFVSDGPVIWRAPIPAIPELPTWVLTLAGLVGVALLKWKR